MNRFRDDGPPLKKYRNDRSDFSNSRGNTSDGAGHDGPRRGGGDDRFQSSSGPGRGGAGRFEKNPDIERHNAPPSRVLHVRGLRDYATQNDLVDAVKNFGRVTYVMMLPRNRQALIEFENVDCAKQVVRFLETSAIYVCGQPAFFNFSTSDSIKRPEGVPDFDQGPMNSSESKILVIVVQNPKYPITVDVMHTICSPHGDVLRIMVMRKQTVTALVEFDSFDSAQKAKQALHGCDVYSGCCTLKIEFAGPELQRLNVMKNDKETFDYTNPNPGAAGRSLLGDGPPGGFGGSGGGGWDDGGNNQNSFNEPFSNSGFNNQRGGAMGNDSFNGPGGGGGGFNRGNMGGMGGNFNDGGFGGRGGRGGGRGGFHGGRGGFQGGRGGMSGPMMGMGGPGGGGGPMPGSVLLIYGLATGKFTCDKLFNIFCIYGNVVSVKILRTKEGGAMINMQDHASCERAIMNLNHAYFFGKALSVSFSKQEFVKIHPNPSELDDGTPSARDYSNNKNNRFFSPDSINKTRFSPPTKVLHFFNAPPTFTEEEMMEVMKNTGTAAPERVRVFPIKAGARSAAGLIEYAGLDDACETIVCANHTIIPNPTGKMPFSLKLSFSASPIIDKPMGRDRGDREAGGDRDN